VIRHGSDVESLRPSSTRSPAAGANFQSIGAWDCFAFAAAGSSLSWPATATASSNAVIIESPMGSLLVVLLLGVSICSRHRGPLTYVGRSIWVTFKAP
jgi:hypothetical protein